MSEDADLLRAIQARPDDAALRQVYADWLEEHGDPRGELIRLEAELARAGHERRREAEMAARRRQLRQALAGAVLPPVLGPVPSRAGAALPERPAPPRVRITYPIEAAGGSEERELPFVVGVLADLSGHRPDRPPLRGRPFVSLDRDNFDAVLARLGPRLRLELPQGEGAPRVDLAFERLGDFGPARLVEAVPQLRRLRDEPARLSALLRAILHHPDFRRLEAAWRGLRYLVEQTETGELLKVRVLDVGKAELRRDFERATSPEEAALFAKVCTEEGGYEDPEPFGLLVGDCAFGHGPEDVALLGRIAQVAAAAHAPFVAAASPQMFGLESFAGLAAQRDLSRHFRGTEHIPWRDFRESEESRYAGLTLPRVLARLPYGGRFQAVEGIDFDELAGGDSPDVYLWMSAAWAYAARVTAAFARHGWLARTRGVQGGGRVEGLPTHTAPTDDGDTAADCPTEVALNDRREFELSDNGFLPLLHYRNFHSWVFMGAQSCHVRHICPNSGGILASGQLTYPLCAARFVHCLEVLARDWLRGPSFTDRESLTERLSAWINRYVNGQPDEDYVPNAERPLSAASVEVADVKGRPGHYSVAVRLRPCYQMEADNLSVRFVAQQMKGGG
jgi:type VI secretion system protein ImpC